MRKSLILAADCFDSSTVALDLGATANITHDQWYLDGKERKRCAGLPCLSSEELTFVVGGLQLVTWKSTFKQTFIIKQSLLL